MDLVWTLLVLAIMSAVLSTVPEWRSRRDLVLGVARLAMVFLATFLVVGLIHLPVVILIAIHLVLCFGIVAEIVLLRRGCSSMGPGLFEVVVEGISVWVLGDAFIPTHTPWKGCPDDSSLLALVGQDAVCKSAMRPQGTLNLGGCDYEAVAEQGYIDRGGLVTVTGVKNNRLVVAERASTVSSERTSGERNHEPRSGQSG